MPFKRKSNSHLSAGFLPFQMHMVHLTFNIILPLLYFLVFDLELALFIPYIPIILDLGYFSLFLFIFFVIILFICIFFERLSFQINKVNVKGA